MIRKQDTTGAGGITGTSIFTAVTVPGIVTVGGYGLVEKIETASFAIEIQRAQDLGLDNVVEQLKKNLQKEIDKNTPILDRSS